MIKEFSGLSDQLEAENSQHRSNTDTVDSLLHENHMVKERKRKPRDREREREGEGEEERKKEEG